jgi:hypothetical protein
MSEQAPNPYAAPSAEAEQPSVRFSLDDEQRRIITQTATLMMVAGVMLLIPTLINLARSGISAFTLAKAAVFGIVAVFVAIAGFSLRGAASEGSLDALLSGFRQLHVAFLVKGIVLLVIVGLFLLGLLLMVLGVGIGFASLFS